MSCPVPEMLSSFLDDELSSDERGEVEAHLSACENCLQVLKEMKEMALLFVRSYEVIEPTTHLTGKLWQGIEPAPLKKFLLSFRNVPAFAGVVLILVSGIWAVAKLRSGSDALLDSGKFECSIKGGKGLCCPESIRSNFMKINGLTEVSIDAKKSKIQLSIEKGKSVKISQIQKALRHCWFRNPGQLLVKSASSN